MPLLIPSAIVWAMLLKSRAIVGAFRENLRYPSGHAEITQPLESPAPPPEKSSGKAKRSCSSDAKNTLLSQLLGKQSVPFTLFQRIIHSRSLEETRVLCLSEEQDTKIKTRNRNWTNSRLGKLGYPSYDIIIGFSPIFKRPVNEKQENCKKPTGKRAHESIS